MTQNESRPTETQNLGWMIANAPTADVKAFMAAALDGE